MSAETLHPWAGPHPHARCLLGVALIVLVACDGAAIVDAGATLEDADVSSDPAPPRPVAPVGWSECPTGWRAVPASEELDVATLCEPWPASGRASCTGTSAHFAGEPGCRTIGGDCAAAEWPADLPAAGVIHVAPGGDGDGTRAAPFGSIADAIGAVKSGEIIALARGTYAGPIALPRGVSLYGACPATTVIEIAAAGTTGNLIVAGGAASVRSLRLTGPQPGIRVSGGAALDVRDVVIDRAGGIGLFVLGRGTTVDVEDLIVRGTTPDASGRFGVGIDVEGGARVEAARVVLDRNTQAAVLVFDAGSVFEGRSVVAFDTEQRPADLFGGNGLRASEGGSVIAEASVIEHNRRTSVLADTGGHVALRETIVRDTREGELAAGDPFPTAHGIAAQEGARVELDRVWLDRHGDLAMYVSGAETSLMGEDVVITRTRSRLADGRAGTAIFGQLGARVALARVVIHQAREVGVGCFEEGTEITLTDARIVDTLARAADGRGGRAISLEEGCSVTLERASIEDSRDIAVAARTGSHLVLRDTRVLRSVADDLQRGYGVLVAMGSSASFERVSIEESTEVGLVAGTDSRIDAVDLSISATAPDESGLFGRGLHAQANAIVDAERVAVDGNREIGVCVALGAEVTLRGALVAGTRSRTCGADCPGGEGGFGLAVYEGSRLTLERFIVRDNDLAGIVVRGGQATLSAGSVSGHPVGLNVEDGDPEGILGDAVIFEDNDLDLDASRLVLPDPGLDE